MKVRATMAEAYQLLHDGMLAFGRAEQAGMRIDVEYCVRKQKQLQHRIEMLENNFKRTRFYSHWSHVYGSKTNIQANQQLAHMLYDVRKIVPPNMSLSGRGSVDEETLEQIELPEMHDLVRIRKLAKLKTNLAGIVREQHAGWLHPFFNLHTVRTFRSSSDRINFQNLPKRDEFAMNVVRRAIFPRLGHLIGEVDYSGAEIRIACCYCEDPKLIDDVLHGDMHKDMAMELYLLDDLDKSILGEYNLRQGGKNGFVFPQFYGGQHETCARALLRWAGRGVLRDGTPALAHLSRKGLVKLNKDGSVGDSKRFVEHVKKIEDDFWHVRYRVYTRWKERWWARYQRDGYFDMLTGFRCSGLMEKNDALNYPIQGTAFHCLLWSFIEIERQQRANSWNSRLIGQIHDAMVADIEPAERDRYLSMMYQVSCVDLKREWKWMIVPMELEAEVCEVDCSWNTKQAYKLAA